MTREEADFIGGMNMCDEISNEAYKKIMCHCEEQKPCEDCISRQAAVDAINTLHEKPNAWLDSAVDAVMALPSVTPQQKIGQWIADFHGFPPEPTTVCSECGFDRDFYIRPRGFDKLKFCPNCGAKIHKAESEG